MDNADRIRLRREARTLWSRPDSWPFEAPDHVFLTKAIHALGAMLFPGQWPSDISDVFDSAQFDAVSSALREHCAHGRLVGALQTSYGAISSKLPPHVWNRPDYVEWLATGKAPLILCYDDWHPLAKVPQCWLFIEEAGLAALNRISPDAVIHVKSGQHSPWPREPTEKKRHRTPQQLLIAKKYVVSRFPDGVPGVGEMTDTVLVNEVFKEMAKAVKNGEMVQGTEPKRDTVLRAAGRRKIAAI